MSCPICGANCRCKNRGPHGECCGCHSHKAQRGYTRFMLNAWRLDHHLDPVPDDLWQRWEQAATKRRSKERHPELPFEGDEPTM